nr:RecName: Full=F-box C protein 38 [Caenorhabditis elegans]|eukprot:NP_509372.2 F-box C protein 38 [Caenorhabditis elegans]
MSTSRPLSYPSLKCVLQHIDYNLRPKVPETALEKQIFEMERNPKLYTQLIITSKRCTTIEVVENLRNLPECLEYLLSKILNHQKKIISIETMSIKLKYCDFIPRNLRLKVRRLIIARRLYEEDILRITEIIDSTSPLEKLELDWPFDFEHPIVTSAKLLVFNIATFFDKIRNTRVHFTYSKRTLRNLNHRVDWWTKEGKDIGTHYSFDVGSVKEGKYNIKQINNFFKGRLDKKSISKTGCVSLEMDNTSRLDIYCEEAQNNWTLNLKVVANE